ncbi:alkaline phosphatase [Luteimonas cucumeris]|nr:alkaline phosphatase [Luteimonas cucumeris]
MTLLLAACVSSGARDTAPATTHVEVPAIQHPQGENAAWWFRDGAAQAAGRGAMQGRAKNVILFVGDGMSLTTVAAARILQGQRNGGPGENNRLGWENFPHTALSKTYNTDSQTPDSAGTMSAMATGIKTRAGVLSIGQSALRKDCTGALAAPMLSILELAESAGLATGIVTTARITHATPGATYSHSAERNWENDTELSESARAQGCADIARQLIENPYGNGPEVVFGGGRMHFMTVQQRDPEADDKVGLRLDGRDLIGEWQRKHPDGAYVWNREQLAAASGKAPVLGLFEYDHLHFEHDRSNDPGEPSLAELTTAAITRLQQASPEGYFLLVEGGRIDHAHHYGNAYRALTDTIALSDAVQAAAQLASAQDTLILVTADHAHTLTFAGYPKRGNPILGKVRGRSSEDEEGNVVIDGTGLPYTTLGYANGPGYTGASSSQPAGPKKFLHSGKGFEPSAGRPDLNQVDTMHPDYMQEVIVPLSSETHGGDDVGIWARGPGSDAVRGSVEQNTIFHFMVQATPKLRERLCVAKLCNGDGVPVELPDPAEFVEVR